MTKEKTYEVDKPDEEWRKGLASDEYVVLRQAGTGLKAWPTVQGQPAGPTQGRFI